MNEQPQSTGLQQPAVMGIATAPESPIVTATSSGVPAVNNFEMLDEKETGFLKGLGIEEFTPESLKKLVQAGINQKDSVSRISREKAELEAKLAGLQQPVEPQPSIEGQSEPVAQPVSAPAQPAQAVQPQAYGATKNDAWDISQMIVTNFPDLKDVAASGEIFNDLTMRGLYGVNGVDKEGIYNYLSSRNAEAKEIRELREFKAKYEQAMEPEPQYNVNGVIDNGVKDINWANQVIAANITNPGAVSPQDLAEATRIKQASLF